MFSFIYQSADWLIFEKIHFFVLFFVFIWIIWLSKAIVSLFYKNYKENFSISNSVVIPVVDEDPKFFEMVLSSIIRNKPDEVLVVINGKRNEAIEKVCQKFTKENVKFTWTKTPGKRNALKLGFEKAKGEIVLIVDSDTLWTEDTLNELLKPFKDEKVGGVTTRQKVYEPNRNALTRFADWLEDIRSIHSLPAMSVFGTVGCLPGRTIAFRKSILLDSLDEFLNDKFLGTHLEVSDDRSLTNYTLKRGYKTVYQRTSVVYTDAPTNFTKFLKQQLRWSKGSQYNTLRMIPWMLVKAPYLAFLYITEIIQPFFLYAVFFTVILKAIFANTGTEIIKETALDNFLLLVIVSVFGAIISLGLRQLPHLINKPADFIFLPVFILLVTFVLSVLRIVGFAVMAEDHSWGTRTSGYKGNGTGVNGHAVTTGDLVLSKIPYLLALGLMLGLILLGMNFS